MLDNFLLSSASSSALIILAVVVFGIMSLAKMSSFRIMIAALAMVGIYALIDNYKEKATAVSNDGKIISYDSVCINGIAHKANKDSTFGSENLTPILDANGSTIPCRRLSETK